MPHVTDLDLLLSIVQRPKRGEGIINNKGVTAARSSIRAGTSQMSLLFRQSFSVQNFTINFLIQILTDYLYYF